MKDRRHPIAQPMVLQTMDFESALSLTCKCRRFHTLRLLVILIGLFLLRNVSLFIQVSHNHSPPTRTLPRTSPKRRRYTRSVEPIPASLAQNATFSSCLLLKDDNEILPEFLAYHYHSVNLRNLVVAVDPTSTQSPDSILKRWQHDMTITLWNDSDFMPKDFLKKKRPPKLQKKRDFPGISKQALLEISNHRYRQQVFLSRCMKYLRKQKASWVMHIDTDEYVITSQLLREQQPSHIHLPPIQQPGSVLSVLQQVVSQSPKTVNYPCIPMVRSLFGSMEDSTELPAVSDFDPRQFETLRWSYHANPTNITFNGNPKVMIDLQAIPSQKFDASVFSIHRPYVEYCSLNLDIEYSNVDEQPISVNHYLGSWERYSGRADNRRSRSKYKRKASVAYGQDHGIQPWLSGFVNGVGLEKAKRLLGDSYLLNNAEHNSPLLTAEH